MCMDDIGNLIPSSCDGLQDMGGVSEGEAFLLFVETVRGRIKRHIASLGGVAVMVSDTARALTHQRSFPHADQCAVVGWR